MRKARYRIAKGVCDLHDCQLLTAVEQCNGSLTVALAKNAFLNLVVNLENVFSVFEFFQTPILLMRSVTINRLLRHVV